MLINNINNKLLLIIKLVNTIFNNNNFHKMTKPQILLFASYLTINLVIENFIN